jgi:hypothetical protein
MTTPVPPPDGRTATEASPRTLAELARSGFSLVREPSMRVVYEVHHVDDHPRYLHDVLAGRPGTHDPRDEAVNAEDETAVRFIETLTTSAYSAGLVIGTRTIAGNVKGPEILGVPAVIRVHDRRGDARLFTGTTVPNVSFVYDPEKAFEGLIAIDDVTSPLRAWHGRALLDAVEHVAAAAGRANGPVLSLQSPAQLPPQVYTPPAPGDTLEDSRPRQWPLSAAVALRFLIALRDSTARQRLDLTDAVAEFCLHHGFGLWLADQRSGFRSGSWFPICERNEQVASAKYRSDMDTGATFDPPRSMPVTFVGPARPGAVGAIVNYLAWHPEIRLWACSMSIVDDVAFVHFQLASTTSPAEDLDRGPGEPVGAAERIWDAELADVAPPTVLPELLLAMGANSPPAEAPPDVVKDLHEKVADFHLLTGPAKVIDGRTGTDRLALWVSWEIEGEEAELSKPFLALHHVIESLRPEWGRATPHPDAPNLEYLICRRVRHGALRGKGKISFPPDLRHAVGEDLQSGLSGLCERIEEAWMSELGQDRYVRELTVSWRENWLGHWNLPLD